MRNANIAILLITVISILTLGFIQPSIATGTATLSINPMNTTLSQAQVGTTFKVNITVTNVTNLWDWKVRLNWNPQVLNLTNVEEGPFLKSGGPTLFTWPEGASQINQGYLPEIYCALFVTSGVNGSGVLATVTFKALTSGASAVSMNETWLNTFTSPIAHTIVDGYVVITESPPSLSPAPTSSPESTPSPSPSAEPAPTLQPTPTPTPSPQHTTSPTPQPEESQLFFFAIVTGVAFALIGLAALILKKRRQ